MISQQGRMREGGMDWRRMAALEQLADAVQALLPRLRSAEQRGVDCARELDALELALERVDPAPPLSS